MDNGPAIDSVTATDGRDVVSATVGDCVGLPVSARTVGDMVLGALVSSLGPVGAIVGNSSFVGLFVVSAVVICTVGLTVGLSVSFTSVGVSVVASIVGVSVVNSIDGIIVGGIVVTNNVGIVVVPTGAMLGLHVGLLIGVVISPTSE